MTVLIGLFVIVVIGFGAVFWLLKNEKDDLSSSIEKLVPDQMSDNSGFDSSNVDTLGGTEEPLPLGEEIDLDGSNKKKSLFAKLLPKKKEKASSFGNDLQIGAEVGKSKSLLSKLNLSKFLPSKKNGPSSEPSLPSTGETKSSNSLVGKLLSKVKGLRKKKDDNYLGEPMSMPSLQDTLKKDEEKFGVSVATNKPTNPTQPPEVSTETGTASLKTTPEIPEPKSEPEPQLTKEEEKEIENEVNVSFELTELKSNYENLDKLFKEKSELLEKAEESLKTELNNRKDFNKVKDILEKELKDIKDELKNTKTELTNKENEYVSLQDRIDQLEGKATNLEKELLKKDDEIEKLKKETGSADNIPSETPSAEKEGQDDSTSESEIIDNPPFHPTNDVSTEDTPKTEEDKLNDTEPSEPKDEYKEYEMPKLDPISNLETNKPDQAPDAENSTENPEEPKFTLDGSSEPDITPEVKEEPKFTLDGNSEPDITPEVQEEPKFTLDGSSEPDFSPETKEPKFTLDGSQEPEITLEPAPEPEMNIEPEIIPEIPNTQEQPPDSGITLEPASLTEEGPHFDTPKDDEDSDSEEQGGDEPFLSLQPDIIDEPSEESDSETNKENSNEDEEKDKGI